MRRGLETIDAIDKLKELRPDWDSYGAAEIMLSAREHALAELAEIVRPPTRR